METTVYNPDAIRSFSNVSYINISATETEIEDHTGMATGFHVSDIDVKFENGTVSRFHLYLRIKNGRPIAEISHNNRDGTKSISKSIVGWKSSDTNF